MEKEIVFVLLDDFADWEAAFLAPALRAGTMPGRPASYGVKYMTPDGRPVRSIGGLRAAADCDAFLNGVRHTGNTLGMLQKWGGANYTGEELYEERQAVRDGNVVTANGTGQLEFTRECLLALSADTPEAIEASYKFNKEGFCGR